MGQPLAPLCFVLMPFGRKLDSNGMTIDFDAVYGEIIKPAIDAAELDPIRADEEQAGGIIHKAMFERLILCDFGVADLTTANANVFYELGVRHAVRPWSTVLMFAQGGRLPFDVSLLRAMPYSLGADGKPAKAEADRHALQTKLEQARKDATKAEKLTADSPLYQLVHDYPNVQREKTDVFRDHVNYGRLCKDKLAKARETGVEAVEEIEREIDPERVEPGVLVDLFLSYRAVEAWQKMVDLVEKMPKPLAASVMVREQQALALNRLGAADDAERILLDVIARHGPSSETYGLLGRVYKDRWKNARATNKIVARGFLKKAVDTYRKGFETDWRDPFPGINALTLTDLQDPNDPSRQELLPLVRYAADRRVAAGKADYWDYATLLEIAVLERDEAGSMEAVSTALAHVREKWEPKSTAGNLGLIAEVRRERGEAVPGWLDEVIAALIAHSAG